jgi:hypothetical protein
MNPINLPPPQILPRRLLVINTTPTLGFKPALLFSNVGKETKLQIAEIISVETSCANSDTFTQVTSGKLIVRGNCFRIRDFVGAVELDSGNTELTGRNLIRAGKKVSR